MKCWLTVCKIALSVPLAVIGFGAWAWGVFCWAGGPDGRIGSPESILYGSAFGLAALVCAFLFVLLNGRKRWALLAIGLIYGAILLAVLLVADMGRAMRQGRTAAVQPDDRRNAAAASADAREQPGAPPALGYGAAGRRDRPPLRLFQQIELHPDVPAAERHLAGPIPPHDRSRPQLSGGAPHF